MSETWQRRLGVLGFGSGLLMAFCALSGPEHATSRLLMALAVMTFSITSLIGRPQGRKPLRRMPNVAKWRGVAVAIPVAAAAAIDVPAIMWTALLGYYACELVVVAAAGRRRTRTLS